MSNICIHRGIIACPNFGFNYRLPNGGVCHDNIIMRISRMMVDDGASGMVEHRAQGKFIVCSCYAICWRCVRLVGDKNHISRWFGERGINEYATLKDADRLYGQGRFDTLFQVGPFSMKGAFWGVFNSEPRDSVFVTVIHCLSKSCVSKRQLHSISDPISSRIMYTLNSGLWIVQKEVSYWDSIFGWVRSWMDAE